MATVNRRGFLKYATNTGEKESRLLDGAYLY